MDEEPQYGRQRWSRRLTFSAGRERCPGFSENRWLSSPSPSHQPGTKAGPAQHQTYFIGVNQADPGSGCLSLRATGWRGAGKTQTNERTLRKLRNPAGFQSKARRQQGARAGRRPRRSHSAGRVCRSRQAHPRRGRALTSADQPGGQAIILQGTVIAAVSNGPVTVDSNAWPQPSPTDRLGLPPSRATGLRLAQQV